MRIYSKRLNPPIKPSFSVHRNGTNQTNITGIEKIEWTTEDFDTNSDFDSTTNYRFTPTVAGKYLLTATVKWSSVTTGDIIRLYIYKNGSNYLEDFQFTGANNTQQLSVIVDANGVGDYFEVFAQNSIRDTSQIDGASINSRFTGCKID